MAEIRTVTTLSAKREEIRGTIHAYEQKLAQARVDLAHITAAIAIFEASGDRATMPPYVDVHRLFRRGEPVELCKAALASGPKTMRELALEVMKAKGLDTGDKVLARAIAARLIHALRMQSGRGLILGGGEAEGGADLALASLKPALSGARIDSSGVIWRRPVCIPSKSPFLRASSIFCRMIAIARVGGSATCALMLFSICSAAPDRMTNPCLANLLGSSSRRHQSPL
jgi:hypothetical protein